MAPIMTEFVFSSCCGCVGLIFFSFCFIQVDIFAMDLVLVPVHLGMHWCLAVRMWHHVLKGLCHEM